MFRSRLAITAVICALAAVSAPAGASDSAPYLSAWRIVRVMDCARCHGHDHDGWAAPSVLAFVRSQPRARFDQVMLDGDPSRGMPGYRDHGLVADHLDELYAYFLARASGRLDAGRPAPEPPSQ